MQNEHEGIREEKEKRKKHRGDMGLDWSDYKAMPFTQCVRLLPLIPTINLSTSIPI